MIKVEHRPAERCFETTRNGERAYLYYAKPSDQAMDIMTTFTPPALRGSGIGRELVLAAQRFAEQRGWQLTATCWYAARVLENEVKSGK